MYLDGGYYLNAFETRHLFGDKRRKCWKTRSKFQYVCFPDLGFELELHSLDAKAAFNHL